MGGGSEKSVWASDAYMMASFGYKCSVKNLPHVLESFALCIQWMWVQYKVTTLFHTFFCMSYPHMSYDVKAWHSIITPLFSFGNRVVNGINISSTIIQKYADANKFYKSYNIG